MAGTYVKLVWAIAFLFAAATCQAEEAPLPVAQLQTALNAVLLPDLAKNQSVISMYEYPFIVEFARQRGVSGVVYFNKYLEVRWYAKASSIAEEYEMFVQETRHPTDAIKQAVATKSAATIAIFGQPQQDVAVPLVAEGTVIGTVAFRAAPEAVPSLVRFTEDYRRMHKPAAQEPAKPTSRVSDETERQALEHYLSGVIWLQKHDYAMARNEWNQSLKLDSGLVDARLGLARLPKTN